MKDFQLTLEGIVSDYASYTQRDYSYCDLLACVEDSSGIIHRSSLQAKSNSRGNIYLLYKKCERIKGNTTFCRRHYYIDLITSYDELYEAFKGAFDLYNSIKTAPDDCVDIWYRGLGNETIQADTLPDKDTLWNTGLLNMKGAAKRLTIDLYDGDPNHNIDHRWYCYKGTPLLG